jgi:hypothetical protein
MAQVVVGIVGEQHAKEVCHHGSSFGLRVALTMARMPALIVSVRNGHAAIMDARSGSNTLPEGVTAPDSAPDVLLVFCKSFVDGLLGRLLQGFDPPRLQLKGTVIT